MIGQTIVCLLIEPLGLLWLGPCGDVISSTQLFSLSEVSGSQMMKTHHEFDTQLLQQREHEPSTKIIIGQYEIAASEFVEQPAKKCGLAGFLACIRSCRQRQDHSRG